MRKQVTKSKAKQKKQTVRVDSQRLQILELLDMKSKTLCLQ